MGSSQINDLVGMRDVETLYDLMAEDEDWMTQLDAAEGLVKLSDRRGLEFLLSATESEDLEIRQVAREIPEAPEVARMRAEIEAEERQARKGKLDTARKRLQSGRKVFSYKMVYLPAGDILSEDSFGEGFRIPDLDDAGLEGWEVVNMIPRRKQLLVGSVDDHFVGAYFLLKKEISPEESSELDAPA
jgi:hypothetical protein